MSAVVTMLHEIFTPTEGNDFPVTRPAAMPPMPPDPNQPGTLCFCNGKVTRDPNGYLYGISIRCKQGTLTEAQFPNSEVTQGSPSTVYIAVGAFIGNGTNGYPFKEWNSIAVPAFGNTAAVPNTIKAVARFFPSGGNPEDAKLIHFNGIWTDSCPAHATAKAAATVAPSETEYHPTESDGSWLLYEGLPVSALGNGNLLSRRGTPLRAKVLAVSAARVHWWSTLNEGAVVRRPVGDLIPTGPFSACPFPGLPRNAIVVDQLQHRHVLVSECRDRPDLIHLNRNENVRIQVNFESPVIPTAQLLGGSYDLWVKVID